MHPRSTFPASEQRLLRRSPQNEMAPGTASGRGAHRIKYPGFEFRESRSTLLATVTNGNSRLTLPDRHFFTALKWRRLPPLNGIIVAKSEGTKMKLDFDLDDYLNPLIPRPWLHRLPRWMSWWLGYRATLPRHVPTVFVWGWTFIGCFCGVSVVEAVMEKSSYFVSRQVPNIVGSFV